MLDLREIRKTFSMEEIAIFEEKTFYALLEYFKKYEGINIIIVPDDPNKPEREQIVKLIVFKNFNEILCIFITEATEAGDIKKFLTDHSQLQEK